MFKRIPAHSNSLSKRKPLCGVGINDADYLVSPNIDGKRQYCPFYRIWKGLIRRCYDAKFQQAHPSYIGCVVTKEWHSFSCFRAWMITQPWEGNQLDKDLLVQGNTVYSPETCVFIPRRLNCILLNTKDAKGYTFNKRAKKFEAQCGNNEGGNTALGYFDTEQEAKEAYLSYKAALLAEWAENQPEPLKSALLRISTSTSHIVH